VPAGPAPFSAPASGACCSRRRRRTLTSRRRRRTRGAGGHTSPGAPHAVRVRRAPAIRQYARCVCSSLSQLRLPLCLLLGRGLRLGWSRPWPVAPCLAGPESVLWPRASGWICLATRRRGLVATASASPRCRVGSCGACMCWCMRSTCEVSYVQGAVMGARFNVRGFKVPGGWGVVQCGDAWSVGSARKAGAWAGRCGLGWSAVLVVHERLGQTAVSQGSVSTEDSRTQAATSLQHAISAAVSSPFITPSSSLDFRGAALARKVQPGAYGRL
jgi:hypothetical protein